MEQISGENITLLTTVRSSYNNGFNKATSKRNEGSKFQLQIRTRSHFFS